MTHLRLRAGLTGLVVGILGALLLYFSGRGSGGLDDPAWRSAMLLSVASSLLASAITFVVVGFLFEAGTRNAAEGARRRQRAEELVATCRISNSRAEEAVDVLRGLGLLVDGSVSGLSFADTDLSGLDLSASDLRGCDLSGCDLSGANLLDARVDRASFRNGNLTNARLEFASAIGADFTGAIAFDDEA